MTTTLVNTNVLVPACGAAGDADRQAKAFDAMRRWRAQGGLSSQVLSECASVLLRKGRSPEVVRQDVRALAAAWRVLVSDPATVDLALTGVALHRMSLWDAMIWATAKQNGLTTILSEDGPTGAAIGGVRFESPF